MTQASSDDIKERLRSILRCLIDYKKTLMKDTLTSQVPNHINVVKTTLRRQCNILTEFMKTREMPDNPDTDLLTCLNCLSPLLTPWDMDLSIVCPDLCKGIFVDSDFNMSDSIIEKIIENYCPTLDDVSYVEEENIQTV